MRNHFVATALFRSVALIPPTLFGATWSVGTNVKMAKFVNHRTATTIAVKPVNPQSLWAAANGNCTFTNARFPSPRVFQFSADGGANCARPDPEQERRSNTPPEALIQRPQSNRKCCKGFGKIGGLF